MKKLLALLLPVALVAASMAQPPVPGEDQTQSEESKTPPIPGSDQETTDKEQNTSKEKQKSNKDNSGVVQKIVDLLSGMI